MKSCLGSRFHVTSVLRHWAGQLAALTVVAAGVTDTEAELGDAGVLALSGSQGNQTPWVRDISIV